MLLASWVGKYQERADVLTTTQIDTNNYIGSTFLITIVVGLLLVLLYQVGYVLRVGFKKVLNRIRNKQAEITPTLVARSRRVTESATTADEEEEEEEEEGETGKTEEEGENEEEAG